MQFTVFHHLHEMSHENKECVIFYLWGCAITILHVGDAQLVYLFTLTAIADNEPQTWSSAVMFTVCHRVGQAMHSLALIMCHKGGSKVAPFFYQHKIDPLNFCIGFNKDSSCNQEISERRASFVNTQWYRTLLWKILNWSTVSTVPLWKKSVSIWAALCSTTDGGDWWRSTVLHDISFTPPIYVSIQSS